MKVIARHRDAREATAFARVLFPQSGLEFETSSEIELVFHECNYGYNQPYKGGIDFKKHLFWAISDLEVIREEFDCAVHLDRCKEVKTWVHNTVRQPGLFWLQTSSGRFYRNFLALLNDGCIRVVEYKSGHLATTDDTREKELVGDFWAERSKGKCLFLIVQDRQFGGIERTMV